MRRSRLITGIAAALLLTACGTAQDPEPAGQPDDATEQQQGGEDFDRNAARDEAEALLGTPEGDIEETPDRRIVRRGDEEFIVTMDLRPGRQNLELDDDGTGTFVVTRIVVETPEGGDDNLVVE